MRCVYLRNDSLHRHGLLSERLAQLYVFIRNMLKINDL